MKQHLPFVSIIIPCRNEEAFIKKVLQDMYEQDYPKELMEVLVIDGMSTDKTAEKVKDFQRESKSLKFIENKLKIVPTALNIGIKNAQGEIIVRIDAHCEYPSNYVSYLVSNLMELNAGNVGVAVESRPKNNNLRAVAIAACMSSPFGIGNSDFRTGTKEIKKTDTVPFGCFKKSVFDNIGLFDEELIRNQDDEFNARMIKNGYDIYILPDIHIVYYTRDTIAQTAHMFYYYGLFKPLVNKKVGSAATLRQFVPPLFVIGNSLALLCLVFNLSFGLIILALIWFPYFLTNFYFSSKIAIRKKNFWMCFVLAYIFLTIHVSYGWGYLKGLFKFQLLDSAVGKDISTNR